VFFRGHSRVQGVQSRATVATDEVLEDLRRKKEAWH